MKTGLFSRIRKWMGLERKSKEVERKREEVVKRPSVMKGRGCGGKRRSAAEFSLWRVQPCLGEAEIAAVNAARRIGRMPRKRLKGLGAKARAAQLNWRMWCCAAGERTRPADRPLSLRRAFRGVAVPKGAMAV